MGQIANLMKEFPTLKIDESNTDDQQVTVFDSLKGKGVIVKVNRKHVPDKMLRYRVACDAYLSDCRERIYTKRGGSDEED